VQHIETQLEILMYLLKQYKWLQIKIRFCFSLTCFVHTSTDFIW
jgi:hypothetical protein